MPVGTDKQQVPVILKKTVLDEIEKIRLYEKRPRSSMISLIVEEWLDEHREKYKKVLDNK